MLITEGSAQNKLQEIEGNDYLSHGLDQLGKCDLPLVVFGSDLGEQDQHLVDALNRNPARPIAVSVCREEKTEKEIRDAKKKIRAGLDGPLYFFDSATHPLACGKRLGGWEIVRAGNRRASEFDETRAGAVKKARAMVRKDGGGEVRIKNELGKVVELKRVRGALWGRRAAA